MPSSLRKLTGRTRPVALLVVATLILVPALLRAWQRFDPHDYIRLSIRLNWNGDAPRAKADVPPDTADASVPSVVTDAGPMWASSDRLPPSDRPLSRSSLDNTPRPLRGPPLVLVA